MIHPKSSTFNSNVNNIINEVIEEMKKIEQLRTASNDSNKKPSNLTEVKGEI